uniref:Small integral membrane protein 15 n=1 Tax=Coturnix japonica TaxID=93934 RepID=A0A8C2SNX1_COTJA
MPASPLRRAARRPMQQCPMRRSAYAVTTCAEQAGPPAAPLRAAAPCIRIAGRAVVPLPAAGFLFSPQGPSCRSSDACRAHGAALPLVQCFPHKKAAEMFDVKAWAVYIVEWAAKDPYGFLTTVILVLTPLFIISAALSWKLAKMIETREREQKKKRKRQENIVKAKRAKKD